MQLVPRAAVLAFLVTGLAILAPGWAESARATVLVINTSAASTTYIRGDGATSQNMNFGATTQMNVGQFGTGDRRGRALFGFDLSSIPAGSVINSISLKLTWGADTSVSASVPVELYQLTGSFDELTTTWLVRQTGVNWTTPGGDFTSLLASASGNPAAAGSFTFTDPAFTSAATTAAGGNLNLLVKLNATPEAGTNRENFTFFTDDLVSPLASRPTLTVDFTAVPEPATWMMLWGGLAVMAIMGMRRQRAFL